MTRAFYYLMASLLMLASFTSLAFADTNVTLLQPNNTPTSGVNKIINEKRVSDGNALLVTGPVVVVNASGTPVSSSSSCPAVDAEGLIVRPVECVPTHPNPTTKVAVSSVVSTSMILADTTRSGLWIVNAGSQIVYVDNVTATTNSFPIYPGTSYLVTVETGATLAWKGIAASGTGDVRLIPITRN
jgi:hypothetical protein